LAKRRHFLGMDQARLRLVQLAKCRLGGLFVPFLPDEYCGGDRPQRQV
jgi:hypothetical protein